MRGTHPPRPSGPPRLGGETDVGGISHPLGRGSPWCQVLPAAEVSVALGPSEQRAGPECAQRTKSPREAGTAPRRCRPCPRWGPGCPRPTPGLGGAPFTARRMCPPHTHVAHPHPHAPAPLSAGLGHGRRVPGSRSWVTPQACPEPESRRAQPKPGPPRENVRTGLHFP